MDRAAWLQQRRTSLGASEVAAVCGLDPFKSAWDIWAVKKGYRSETESEAGEMGNRVEPVILQWYADKTARALRQVGTIKHPRFPWASCTPDALADDIDVQAKLVGARMLSRWDDGVPLYVAAQCGWELWVTDLRQADVVALLGGTDPQIYRLARDERAIGYLVEICGKFWRDCIEGDAVPDIDGSEAARRALEGKFASATAGMVEAVPEFIEGAREYERLGKEIKSLTEQRDQIGNAMRLAIGSAAGVCWPGGRVSWKQTCAGQRPLRVYLKE